MAPTPTPAAQALLGALADRPGATATELAAAAGIGRSTAAKLLATLADHGQVLRQPGAQQGGRKAADRWMLPAAAPSQDPDPPTATPAPSRDQAPAGLGRLRSGQLRHLVLGCLAERPGQALSPTAIAKRLDRSAGAVANALRALAGQGAVTQTQAKPRRYAVTTAAGDQDHAQR